MLFCRFLSCRFFVGACPAVIFCRFLSCLFSSVIVLLLFSVPVLLFFLGSCFVRLFCRFLSCLFWSAPVLLFLCPFLSCRFFVGCRLAAFLVGSCRAVFIFRFLFSCLFLGSCPFVFYSVPVLLFLVGSCPAAIVGSCPAVFLLFLLLPFFCRFLSSRFSCRLLC